MATAAPFPAKTALATGRQRPAAALQRRLGTDWRLGWLFVLPMIVMVLALVVLSGVLARRTGARV